MFKRMVRQAHHKIAIALMVLIFTVTSVHADTTVKFSPQGGIGKTLVKMYQGAKSDIRVAMYSLTVKGQANALIAAHRRGVNVQVILDTNLGRQKTSMSKTLAVVGIPVRHVGPSGGSMHHKFIIVDGKLLATGSYNISNDAEDHSNEAMLFITDKKMITAFAGEFDRLWQKGKQVQ
jgi:phosphatidylserine/phosphatidylglycerophosphate/cardiolipin synthase-like enzyme